MKKMIGFAGVAAMFAAGLLVTLHDPPQPGSGRQDLASKLDASARACADLRPGLPVDATPLIAKCLQDTPEGGTLALAPGVYTLQTVLKIQRPVTITTEGFADGEAPCRENKDLRCAELRAAGAVTGIDRGFIVVDAGSVTFSHLVVNGNKQNRQSGNEARQCRAGQNGAGINIHTTQKRFHFESSSSINALCGTGLEVAHPSDGLIVTGSFIAHCGIHNIQNLWSDGVTISDSRDAEVSGNEILDNTDVDLIFGGCQNCRIHHNQITHSRDFAGSSFAALMLHAWPQGTSGDYSQSLIEDNMVNCGPFRCGFGLLIGASPWYKAPTFGGVYRRNHITGAQVGFAVNDATGPVQIGMNTVENSGGTFNTSAGTRLLKPLALSKASTPHIQWSDGAEKLLWATQDLTGALPNWWAAESAGIPEGMPAGWRK